MPYYSTHPLFYKLLYLYGDYEPVIIEGNKENQYIFLTDGYFKLYGKEYYFKASEFFFPEDEQFPKTWNELREMNIFIRTIEKKEIN